MFSEEVYRVKPIINDSFTSTIKELIEYKTYNERKYIKYHIDVINPDSVQLGQDLSSLKRPEFIYITFNYMNESEWTNHGGYEFCTCSMLDGTKLLVNWDTNTSSKRIRRFEKQFIRRLKLMKIKNSII